jgi:hypothetical protein
MASIQQHDRRLRNRRSGPTPSDEPQAEVLESQADLADNVRQPSEEELEKLRRELVQEREVRTERIRQALERAAQPLRAEPPRPVEPFEDNEI